MSENVSNKPMSFNVSDHAFAAHMQNLKDDMNIDFSDMLKILKSQAKLIIGVFVVSMLAMTAFIVIVPAQYESNSQVLISSEQPNIPALKSLKLLVKKGDEQLYTEAEILRSDRLTRKVVEALRLHQDTDFINAQTQSQDLAIALGGEKFQKHLNVYVSPGTNVINVEVTDNNRDRAALLANNLVSIYMAEKRAQKRQEINKFNRWIEARYEEAERKALQSQQEAQNLKERYQYVSPLDLEVKREEIAALSKRLMDQRIKFSETYARLQDIRGYDNGSATRDILSSEIIQSLKDAELKIRKELELLTKTYGPKHPLIVDINSRLSVIEERINDEISNIETALENELDSHETIINDIDARLSALKEAQAEASMSAEKIQMAEQEAETNAELFHSLLKETVLSHQDDLDPIINARVISEATPATEASFPLPAVFYALAGIFGLFFGVVLAFVKEMSSQRVRSATELENFTGLSCYGLSPKAKDLKPSEAARYILSGKAMKDAELIRSIRAMLNLRSKDETPPKILTVTSSLPGEGKTTLSTWLSVLTARAGEKVIVIDCDFRNATLHTSFNRPNKTTLVEYLSNESSLEDVIYREDPSGVHAIFAKNIPGQALELINSKRMRTLIESLGKAYDLVILDCPTALAVSDALYLSKQSDLTLFNVAWNQTNKETIKAGLKQFKEADIHSLAVILSKVDRQQYPNYAQDLQYYMRES